MTLFRSFKNMLYATGLASSIGCGAAALAESVPASADSQQAEQVRRGAYLFRAADCAACHTAPDGAGLTGGRPFTLPFGTVFAVNITPDKQTGIGNYTDTEWLRMLQDGVGRGGKHLYPVMPYTAYTLLSDADALAIRAYLFSLKPQQAPARQNQLSFPFNQRWGLIFWNWLNNPDKRFQPDPARSGAWNRGAYLTEALGHCSQCHTPRTLTYGLSRKAYAGALQMGWRAYNLTSDRQHGLGNWSEDQLASYLSTGVASGKGPASGPMAEAVEHGLRYMTQEDIAAMVTYLRSLPPIAEGPVAHPMPSGDAGALNAVARRGEGLFAQACAGCHLPDGQGRQSAWAALGGAHSVSDPAGDNLVQVLRTGTALETAQGRVFMPGFSKAYTAEELAAITAYVTAYFGNTQTDIKASAFKN
ncbi:cytochrome c [Acetobacter persici]|uniref:Alcohol dehydrogenase n=1 Tax=Acetobacter persici TaxID=1076596 RepID=A0A6V8I8L5_9PROT|nr:cytochrome c [Acetobacter persici]OUI93280.1 alcohol dehydrogenase [Acetobacter persici]GFE93397.1 alcohol dehydrogenase [Acetobacter persici]